MNISVAILPFRDVERTLLQRLVQDLAPLGVHAELLPAADLPPGAYNRSRKQYRAEALLALADGIEARAARHDSREGGGRATHGAVAEGRRGCGFAAQAPGTQRVLGVTDADLYVDSLNFVFGLAESPGRAAVISTARLRNADETLCRSRVLKEAIHELGHTLGLGHCHDPRCVMHFSNTLADTDRKGSRLCQNCRARLSAGSPGREHAGC
jgi:predicted Zn-dependent protease